MLRQPALRLLEAHLLIRTCEGGERDQADRRLLYPRPDAVQRRALQEGGLPHALVQEGLHAMQEGLACRAVALRRLLPEQRVEIGVTAIGIETGAEHVDLEAVGRIAENGGVG